MNKTHKIFLVFIIFVAHAIYSLLYVRDFGVIKKMILTVLFSIIPFLAWIIYGPGKYASQYKADSLAYYLWHLKTKGEVLRTGLEKAIDTLWGRLKKNLKL